MTVIKKERFNESTRVQMPVFVHLTRLGYEYFGEMSEEMAEWFMTVYKHIEGYF